MTTSVELAWAALEQWKIYRPGQTVEDWCQAFTGYYMPWMYRGYEEGIVTYPSAEAAYWATPGDVDGTDFNPPPGAIVWWQVGQYGHVGWSCGGGYFLNTSKRGDTIETLELGLKVSSIASYDGGSYRGWTYLNGVNGPFPGLESYGSGSWVRPGSLITREQANQLAEQLARPYNSREYWADVQQWGKWIGAYPEDYAIDGDPREGTFAAEPLVWAHLCKPKVGPTQRQVVSGQQAIIRDDVRVDAEYLGAHESEAIVDFSLWAIGDDVGGNDIWFGRNINDWSWSGGFQDTGTHDLTQVILTEPKPEQPEDPELPEEPEEPTQPEEPEQPEQPDEQEEPEQPGPVKPTPPPSSYPTPTEDSEQKAVEIGVGLLQGQYDVAGWVHARVRTLIPLVLGPVLTWLVAQFPSVAEWLTTQAADWQELIFAGASAAFGFGYWALAGWLGKRWPWAERIMLGSSKKPVYLDAKKEISS